MIYRLYGSGAATASAVASLDIREDDVIEAVWWSIFSESTTSQSIVWWEASFASAQTFSTNDNSSSISVCGGGVALLTSGAYQTFHNTGLSGLAIPVSAGERLYLHLLEGGTVIASQAYCYLYTAGKASRPSVRRR